MTIWQKCVSTLMISVCSVVVTARAGFCEDSNNPTAGSAKALVEQLTSISPGIDGGPLWSPDGSRIAYESSSGKPGLWAVGSKGGAAPNLLFAEGDIETPQWAPVGKWIAYLSAKSGYPELWLWNVEAGSERQLTRLGARINALSWSPDGKWIAFSADRYGSFDIWKVGVSDGQVYRLTANSHYSMYPSWSPDSKSIAYVRTDDRWVDHDIVIMPASGGAGRVLVHDTGWFDYGTIWTNSTFGTPQFSPDGKTVLFHSYRSGWVNYWTVGLTDAQPKPLAPEPADQTDGRWSPDGRQVAYVSNHNGTLKLCVVGADGAHLRSLVDPQLGVVSHPEWSPSGDRISYSFATPVKPADLFVVTVADGTVVQLTFSGPDSHLAQQLIVPEKITYPSTEGFMISAYLYKPASSKDEMKFPGILWIHGGPTSQYTDTYSPLVQFLAQQGYVILLPNIRGSSGYSKNFEDANNACWGHCDLQDVLAGVTYLKTLPYINAQAMGITGTSYGGCMSMDAVAFAPGVFQAAIPMSGYGDWVSFMSYNTELRHTKMLAYELGPFPERSDIYRKVSPIYATSNVTTPVFLVQGDGPTTAWRPGEDVPPASLDFARALEEGYKVYRFKRYVNRGEPGHYGPYYVTGRENTMLLGLDMLDFFNQYLKDGVIDATSSAKGSALEQR